MLNYTKTLIALVAVLSLSTLSAYAVPAYPGVIKHKQSDGTIISIRVFGDEFKNYTTTSDGYTITGGEDGDYYYAQTDLQGKIIPTIVKAKPLSRLTSDERTILSRIPKGIRPLSDNAIPRYSMSKAPSKAADGEITAPEGVPNTAITIGEMRTVIILAEFSDVKFTIADPLTEFTNMLSQEGYSNHGATGSVTDYYQTASRGQFNPKFDVYGPYTLKRKASAYAGNSGVDNVGAMIEELCELADDDINFADYAVDGVMRDVFVFFAGHNQSEGAPNTIWPHRMYLFDSEAALATFDGVDLRSYALASEMKGSFGGNVAGISTFCHEYGHVLGWIDVYDTDPTDAAQQSTGCEFLDIMSYGNYNNEGRTPPVPSLLQQWMVGWAKPEVITEAGLYNIPPIVDGKGYLIETETHNEYFLIENRGGAEGSVWDKYLGNVDGGYEGLYVTHIDYTTDNQDLWSSNMPNGSSLHECVKMVRSTGDRSADHLGDPRALSPNSVLFPGDNNVTLLTSESNELYKAWDESEIEMSLYNIHIDGSNSSFYARGYNSVGDSSYISIDVDPTIGTAIPLMVSNLADGASVRWVVNGESTSQDSVTFNTSAIHYITAIITYGDGTEEQITKYIEL